MRHRSIFRERKRFGPIQYKNNVLRSILIVLHYTPSVHADTRRKPIGGVFARNRVCESSSICITHIIIIYIK